MSNIDYIIQNTETGVIYFKETDVPSNIPSNKLIRRCKDSRYKYVDGKGCVSRCPILDADGIEYIALDEIVDERTGLNLTLNPVSLRDYPNFPPINFETFYYDTLKPEDILGYIPNFKNVSNARLIAADSALAHYIALGLDASDLLSSLSIEERILLSRMQFKKLARMMSLMGLNPDASKCFNHFLNGSGDTIEIDLKTLYEADASYMSRLLEIKNVYIKAIKMLHLNNKDIGTKRPDGNIEFTVYSKKLITAGQPSNNSSKIILGRHFLYTFCNVIWNKSTGEYSCKLYYGTWDVWDPNKEEGQKFNIPSRVKIIDSLIPLWKSINSIKTTLQAMRWFSLENKVLRLGDKDTIFGISYEEEPRPLISVSDSTWGAFETFGLARSFLVNGDATIDFNFKVNDGYDVENYEECCPEPKQYTRYNPDTDECDCGLSDENENYKKYQLITNYIYSDPDTAVSSINNDKKIPIKTNAFGENLIPIFAYCDCPGNLILEAEKLSNERLSENADKKFNLYCVCPDGMVLDPNNDELCICEESVENNETMLEMCKEKGYQTYANPRPRSEFDKHLIFIQEDTDGVFPFDYSLIKPSTGCDCDCLEGFFYNPTDERCVCKLRADYYPNPNSSDIKSVNFEKFKLAPFLKNYYLQDVNNKCDCPDFTESITHGNQLVEGYKDCKCKKSNTFYSRDLNSCICLDGLIEHPDTKECVCEQDNWIYDYENNECVPPGNWFYQECDYRFLNENNTFEIVGACVPISESIFSGYSTLEDCKNDNFAIDFCPECEIDDHCEEGEFCVEGLCLSNSASVSSSSF